MSFQGRTVIALVLIAMFAGCILTLTFVQTSGLPWVQSAPSGGDQSGGLIAGNGSGLTGEGLNETISERQLQKISLVYSLIQNRYYEDTSDMNLVDGAIKGMLAELQDPYSIYMDAEQSQRFEETTISSTFSGIGAEVTMRNGQITVVSPIKGSPAEKAGIRPDDVILSVNGESLEGLSLNEAVMKIRGPKGTKADLKVVRGDTSVPIEISVVRDDIDIETVHAEMVDDRIGMIEIRQFAQRTMSDFFQELERLEANDLQGLIIDVRNNPGGLLHEVVELIEPFVPEGQTIVQLEDRAGGKQNEISSGGGKPYEIVVLTNRGSASASEILAGAIQENEVGIVMGETTFGKGTVQMTFDSGIRDGSTIKLTVGKWLTPNGNFVEGTGIEPDIEVALPELFTVSPFIRGETYQLDDNVPEVRKLQLMLDGLGYEVDRDDGYFSEQTVQSLQAFQADHDLDSTGKLDEPTMNRLEERVVEELGKPEYDTQLNRAIEYLR